MDQALIDATEPPARDGFLPNFCRVPMVLSVVVTSQLLGVVLTLASSGLGVFWERLALMSFFVLSIALAASGLLCALRPALVRLGSRAAAVLAWLVLVATAGSVTWGAYALTPAPLHGALFMGDGVAGLLGRSLGISAILGALLMRYLYLQHQWRLQVEAEAESRLQKLQARIRPHFLFNSMNTIANLTQTDPQLAEEVVQDLADLFRASLSETRATSTLAKELELAYRYLNIERQRLGDRLRVAWDVEDVPGDALLPPLILQPLVENAVYHGIAPSRRPGLIHIGGTYQVGGPYRRAQVDLCIRNTLPSETETAERRTRGNRMALENVRQRMAAMFEGEGRVVVSRTEGEYLVRLVFPYPWKNQ